MPAIITTPGEVLFPESTHAPGPGTHLCSGSVVSSLVGSVRVDEQGDGERPVVSVVRSGKSNSTTSSSVAPGDFVLCRITRITQRAAFATISCVERGQREGASTTTTTTTSTTTKAVPLSTPLTGIIRAPDVRSTEIDAVQVPACFRPGDVVRARVLSLGDARSFYLTTAADDLGVVFARSEASGVPLVAVQGAGAGGGAQQMRCPVTGAVEKRKVAIARQ